MEKERGKNNLPPVTYANIPEKIRWGGRRTKKLLGLLLALQVDIEGPCDRRDLFSLAQ